MYLIVANPIQYKINKKSQFTLIPTLKTSQTIPTLQPNPTLILTQIFQTF